MTPEPHQQTAGVWLWEYQPTYHGSPVFAEEYHLHVALRADEGHGPDPFRQTEYEDLWW